MMQENKYNRLIVWLLSLFIIAFIATQSEVLGKWISYLLNVLKPIFWALAIAYLLNPLLKWVEAKTRMRRWASVAIIYLILLVFVASLLMFIIPLSYNSATQILNEMPTYSDALDNWLEERFADVQSLHKLANAYNIEIESLMPADMDKWLNDLSNNLQGMFISFGSAVFSFTSGLFKFIVGLILSIYLLLEKEKSIAQAKRTGRAYLGEKRAQTFFELLREADTIFSKYLVGKMLDSLIIGLLCFIGLKMLGIRFAVLFSVIVAVTNMIPYFGPIIGAVPLIVVTLFYSPIKALWAAIFILALQQADGNFIGPMILGGRVGLSPILIIVAVIIGGGLFGVVGMLLCVPVVAVLKNMISRHVNGVLGD